METTEIDPKYVISLTGQYHAGIMYCPECGEPPDNGLMRYAIGLAKDKYGDWVMIIECPKCFEIWYFHAQRMFSTNGHYYYFLEFVKNGMNNHYNPDGSKKETYTK